MQSTYRVIFGDTDQMGIVYYANYLRMFEAARADYWRSLGRTYKDLEDAKVAMPVYEANCVYKRPARYEDLLIIDIEVTEMRPASIRFDYKITRDADLIAVGFTRHAIVGFDGRPKRIPDFIRSLVPIK